MTDALVCHPDTPARTIDAIHVHVGRHRTGISVIYMVHGAPPALRVPPLAKPYRTDGLWRTTCFELFVRTGDESYAELNFSPSGEWAAYAFDAYRAGMRSLDIDETPLLAWPPTIWTDEEFDTANCYALGTGTGPIPGEPAIALSAVIEETDGTKSYWALAHAPGPPDFHNPACFTATLPPPASP